MDHGLLAMACIHTGARAMVAVNGGWYYKRNATISLLGLATWAHRADVEH